MHLTRKEKVVMDYLKSILDESVDTIAYSEMKSDLNIDSKQLRGVLSSLSKKNLITHHYNNDAKMTFIGLGDS